LTSVSQKRENDEWNTYNESCVTSLMAVLQVTFSNIWGNFSYWNLCRNNIC